jgi:hypothetical protein
MRWGKRPIMASAVILVFVLCGVVVLRAVPVTSGGNEITLDVAGRLITSKKVTDAVWYDQESRMAMRLSDGKQAWVAFPVAAGSSAQLLSSVVQNGGHVRVDQERAVEIWRLLATTIVPAFIVASVAAWLAVEVRAYRHSTRISSSNP